LEKTLIPVDKKELIQSTSRAISIFLHPEARPFQGSQQHRSVNITQCISLSGSHVTLKQVYFNRSMSELFAPFFKAGLALDGLEELAYPATPDEAPSGRVESIGNFSQMPQILAFRFRRANPEKPPVPR